VKLHVMGAVSQQIEGKTLAEMMEMYDAVAVAFSDGWKPIQNAGLLQKALEYVKAFEGVVVQLPLMASLADGLMNEGVHSVQYGMPGIPNIAETLLVHRDIELARYTQSKLHISGITTAESLSLIKKAKKEGVQVTCSVTPYHLLFTDEALKQYNSLFKVDPPLRTEKDRKALIKGLEDGSIDCIAVHHKPQDWDAKVKEFEYAKSGMASMDVAWPMLLAAAPNVSGERWVDLLANNIADIFNLPKTTIEEGAAGVWTLFDTDTQWTLNKNTVKSRAYNIPLINTEVKGKASVI
jgi:dihydroorotase